MKYRYLLALIALTPIACATDERPATEPPAATGLEQAAASPALCSESWTGLVDSLLTTGDGRGHGPDLGSEEWKSVIEFRLGVRGQPEVPDRSSQDWCEYVDRRIRERVGQRPM